MSKIKLVIADNDELFLSQLTNYIIEKKDTIDVCSFSTDKSFHAYIKDTSNKIDILAFTENMYDECVDHAKTKAKIILSDNSFSEGEVYPYINKYQKAGTFLNELLTVYAEQTGRVDAIAVNDKPTKIIGVYSPSGGSGKTTISLGLAAALAKTNVKVFYLNCEKIKSVFNIMPKSGLATMSDVYLALKTKGANVGVKIITNQYTEPNSGITYIDQPESSLESNELTSEEIKKLIHDIESLGEYDYVIADFDSEFNNDKIGLLESCDKILMPFTSDILSVNKINVFLNELKLHDELEGLNDKISLILNKETSGSTNIIRSSAITDTKSIVGKIPYSAVAVDIRNVFDSAEIFSKIFSTLIVNVK